MRIIDNHEVMAPNSPDGPVGTRIVVTHEDDGSTTREITPPTTNEVIVEPQVEDVGYPVGKPEPDPVVEIVAEATVEEPKAPKRKGK